MWATFFEVTLANELEISSNSREHLERYRPLYDKLFAKFEGVVSPKAYQRYKQIFAYNMPLDTDAARRST